MDCLAYTLKGQMSPSTFIGDMKGGTMPVLFGEACLVTTLQSKSITTDIGRNRKYISRWT